MRKAIQTTKAPAALGTYSQAIQTGNLVFISGQIPLVPETMEIVEGDFAAHVTQAFNNLAAIMQSIDVNLTHVVKLTIYLVNLHYFPIVNEIMENYFLPPYPARALVQVSALPRNAQIEVEAIVDLSYLHGQMPNGDEF